MTEEEYKRLKAMLDRIAEHQKRLTEHARDAEDDFRPVAQGIVDLLAAAKKRIEDRLDGQSPPLSD